MSLKPYGAILMQDVGKADLALLIIANNIVLPKVRALHKRAKELLGEREMDVMLCEHVKGGIVALVRVVPLWVIARLTDNNFAQLDKNELNVILDISLHAGDLFGPSNAEIAELNQLHSLTICPMHPMGMTKLVLELNKVDDNGVEYIEELVATFIVEGR